MKPGDLVTSVCPKSTFLWNQRIMSSDDSAVGSVSPGDLMVIVEPSGSYYGVIHQTLGIGYFWSEFLEPVNEAG